MTVEDHSERKQYPLYYIYIYIYIYISTTIKGSNYVLYTHQQDLVNKFTIQSYSHKDIHCMIQEKMFRVSVTLQDYFIAWPLNRSSYI